MHGNINTHGGKRMSTEVRERNRGGLTKREERKVRHEIQTRMVGKS